MADRDEATARPSAGLISCATHGADHMATAYSGIGMGWFCRACDRDAAREEGRQEAQQRTDMLAGATGYAAGFDVRRIEGAREMREAAAVVVARFLGDEPAAAIRALPLPGEEKP